MKYVILVLLILPALVIAQTTTVVSGKYQIKVNAQLITNTYLSQSSAISAARNLALQCKCDPEILQPTLTVKYITAGPVSSASSSSSSSASSKPNLTNIEFCKPLARKDGTPIALSEIDSYPLRCGARKETIANTGECITYTTTAPTEPCEVATKDTQGLLSNFVPVL